jgi:hypothetical protein
MFKVGDIVASVNDNYAYTTIGVRLYVCKIRGLDGMEPFKEKEYGLDYRFDGHILNPEKASGNLDFGYKFTELESRNFRLVEVSDEERKEYELKLFMKSV